MKSLKTIFRGGREATPVPVTVQQPADVEPVSAPEPKQMFTTIPEHPAYSPARADARFFRIEFPDTDPQRIINLMNEQDFIAYMSVHRLSVALSTEGRGKGLLTKFLGPETKNHILNALSQSLHSLGYTDGDTWTGTMVAYGNVKPPVLPQKKP